MRKRFFPLLWRFNALIIAASGMLALFVGLFAAYHIARDVFKTPYEWRGIARVDPSAPGDAARPAVRVDTNVRPTQFTRIPGTNVLWSPLMATQSYDYRFSLKEASSTRNYIFYDAVTATSRKLLPADTGLIFNETQLRPDGAPRETAPLALSFEIVERDTNADGILSYEDEAILALAKPDGSGLVRLEQLTGRVIGVSVTEDGKTLVVMLDQKDKISAAHIDLATFAVSKVAPVAR